jgi:hypothetical protein
MYTYKSMYMAYIFRRNEYLIIQFSFVSEKNTKILIIYFFITNFVSFQKRIKYWILLRICINMYIECNLIEEVTL